MVVEDLIGEFTSGFGDRMLGGGWNTRTMFIVVVLILSGIWYMNRKSKGI